MCTALKFIPEWLYTMLLFENERNASIFLQSRKILLHPNMHSSTSYGPQYYMEMGKKRPKLPSDTSFEFAVSKPHAEKQRCFLMHCGCHLL